MNSIRRSSKKLNSMKKTNPFSNRDVISIRDFTKQEILDILKEAERFHRGTVSREPLKSRMMASCFFESSTRTRLSFESAMQKLGGRVIGFSDAKATSTSKGESLSDTMRIVSNYADVIVLRHFADGAARLAAQVSDKPVINAGDGANQHPTQTLIDLYTIQKTQKKIDEIHIAFVGDLKYGRTVHSLVSALTNFSVRLYFVAPPSLQIPNEPLQEVKARQIKFSQHEKIEDIIRRVDVLYMTRIQQERFTDNIEYQRVKGTYRLTPESLQRGKETLCILHPLPRVTEISPEIDAMPQAHYFQQASYGLYVRQAILSLVLS